MCAECKFSFYLKKEPLFDQLERNFKISTTTHNLLVVVVLFFFLIYSSIDMNAISK